MTNLRACADAKGFSLHIGVNRVDPAHYAGWDGKLLACEADAKAMCQIALTAGYTERSLLLSENATRENVTEAIRETADRMKPVDIFLVSYAGHGSQLPDLNQDEGDGADETWCLYNSQLIDDELNELWQLFPPGSRILVISDSCHSGSVTRVGHEGQTLSTSMRMPMSGSMRGSMRGSMSASINAQSADEPDIRPRAMPYRLASRVYRNNRSQYDQQLKQTRQSEAKLHELKATVRLLSGCQDDQQSMDGPVNGVFTSRLLTVWDDGGFTGDYTQFHQDICRKMPPDQTPNHQRHGAENAVFDSQTPFAI